MFGTPRKNGEMHILKEKKTLKGHYCDALLFFHNYATQTVINKEKPQTWRWGVSIQNRHKAWNQWASSKGNTLSYATTHMKLEDIVISRTSKSQRDQGCMVPLVGGIYRSRTPRSRRWNGGCQELWEGEVIQWAKSSSHARWKSSVHLPCNHVYTVNDTVLST